MDLGVICMLFMNTTYISLAHIPLLTQSIIFWVLFSAFCYIHNLVTKMQRVVEVNCEWLFSLSGYKPAPRHTRLGVGIYEGHNLLASIVCNVKIYDEKFKRSTCGGARRGSGRIQIIRGCWSAGTWSILSEPRWWELTCLHHTMGNLPVEEKSSHVGVVNITLVDSV